MAGGPADPGFAGAVESILSENRATLEAIDPGEVGGLIAMVEDSGRLFVLGEGRSGLVARMFAMRAVHLGRACYVVGETITPPIRTADLLIIVSGSGTSNSLRGFADAARRAGANVAAVTVDPASSVALAADLVLRIPAAAKLDRSGERSGQFAGPLFEQAALLLFDAMFVRLASRAGEQAGSLWERHANLE